MTVSEDEISDVEEENVNPNQPVISKLRKLIKKIRSSPKMRQKMKKLCQMCKMKYLTPKIDVKTRWNSTFLMLERAEKYKAPLAALCSSEKKLGSYLLTEVDWKHLNTLCILLQKFERATKLISMERHPTICAYLPTFHWLLESLKSFILDNPGPLAQAVGEGLDKLEKYESEFRINNSKIPYLAVFLNPAIKMSFFKEHKFRNIREIQQEIAGIFEREYETVVDNYADMESENPEDELYAYMYKRPKITKATKEFQKYIQFPLLSYKVDVLDFWRSHQADFPNLSKMARDILPVQAGSVAVERDFSGGSDTVTTNRCSLLPETIRQLQCLKNWYKLS